MVISLSKACIVLHMFHESEKKIMKTTTWIYTTNSIQNYFSHQMTHTLFDFPIYWRWSPRVWSTVSSSTKSNQVGMLRRWLWQMGIIALHVITTGSCLDPMISRTKWEQGKMNFFTSNHTLSCTTTNSHIGHKRLVLYMSISGNYLKR